jgi:hypothetical protein
LCQAHRGVAVDLLSLRYCTVKISYATTADGGIEVTLADGTAIRIGHDVSLVMLRRVMTVLRG